ncbi:Hypothetical protein A7982_03631 [Minicystis rosea]|nr:Hypothetical protein A7982_03631 [Minicystis rosea]
MLTVEAEHGGAAEPKGPSPLAILFAPDRAMHEQARVGRVRGYLLFAWSTAILLGAALAARVDAVSSTLQKLEMSGQLQSMSDRQIADDTRSAERIFQVGSIAKSIVGVPLGLGIACVTLVLLSWFFRGKLKGNAVAPIAAATMLPGALADLLDAVSAFQHASLSPESIALSPRSLSAVLAVAGRPLMDPWIKLGNAFDFFSLWTAVLMGYGLAAAAQVPKRTAVIGTLCAWVCYRLLTHVATGG